MARRRKSLLWVALLGLFALSIVGFYILLVPNNPLTSLFRGDIADNNGRVVTGPYPVKSDFRELRDHGVTTIVSLLDPRIPYESVLLSDERENAKRYGIKLLNFPMASILGQKMGDYYQKDAELAAATIDSLKNEKVYLHCYLGVHRMNVVRGLLEKRGTLTGSYTVREAERNSTSREFDSALVAYRSGKLDQAIANINRIATPDAPALLVRAWSQYRLNRIPDAHRDFITALTLRPTLADPHNGLGFCYLREGKLDSAGTQFQAAMQTDRSNPQAHAGLAMVRYREGNMDDARQYLETSLAADSTNTDARDLLFKINKARDAKAAMIR